MHGSTTARRDVRPQEAVTLDIVAELFDLLFGDPNVADGIKALVARLQTTVLKAAMLNQRAAPTAATTSPALLDSISTVAIRWGKVVNADDPFYLKLSELVNKVQAAYDGNMGVFDDANAELDAFLAERERIEEQQDRRRGRRRTRPRGGNPARPRWPDALPKGGEHSASNAC